MNDKLILPLILAVLLTGIASFFFFLQPPTKFHVENVSATSVTLAWNGNGNFVIYRTEKGNFVKVGETQKNKFTDKTVKAGKTYAYVVRTAFLWFLSTPSKKVSVTTPYVNKSVAFSLSISEISPNFVMLKWKIKNENIAYFTLYKSSNDAAFKEFASARSEAREFMDTDLIQNASYRYKVMAVMTNGTRLYSNVVEANIPYEVNGIVIGPNCNGMKDVDIYADGKKIAISGSNGKWNCTLRRGVHVISPLKKGYIFSPPQKTVDGPVHIQFTASIVRNPIPVPVPISPVSTTLLSNSVTFKWTSSGKNVTYALYLGKSSTDMQVLINGLTATSYETRLEYGCTYFWKVEAVGYTAKSSKIVKFSIRKYMISGRVITNKNSGLSDVKISLNGESVLTNKDGDFSFKGLSGQGVVIPEKIGWTFAPRSVKVDGPTSTIIFKAIPPKKGILWKTLTDEFVYAPIVLQNGDLIVGTLNGNVYKISDSGNILWKFSVGKWILPKPLIDKKENIYFAADTGYLYALDKNGKKKWDFLLNGIPEGKLSLYSSTIYVANNKGYLYAISTDGTPIWAKKLNGILVSKIIKYDGYLYALTEEASGTAEILYKLSPDEGKIVFSKTLKNWCSHVLAVNDDGKMYISNGQNLVLFDVTGIKPVMKWKEQFRGDVYSCVNHNGILYVTAGSELYAVKDGRTLWNFKANGKIFAQPVFYKDFIYIVSNMGTIYIINLKGQQMGKENLGDLVVFSKPTLNSKGVMYLGTFGVYAVKLNLLKTK